MRIKVNLFPKSTVISVDFLVLSPPFVNIQLVLVSVCFEHLSFIKVLNTTLAAMLWFDHQMVQLLEIKRQKD